MEGNYVKVTRRRMFGFDLVLLLGLSILYAAPGHAQQYSLTQIPLPDLSSLPPPANVSGAYVVGYGLSNGGEVVGIVNGLIGVTTQAFVYNQGSSQLLPGLVRLGLFNAASAISLTGTIVGQSQNSFNPPNAVSWQNGLITDLGSLFYITHVGPNPIPSTSGAVAINSQGNAVGSSLDATETATHAALYSGGSVVDLGTLGGSSSEALGINDSGIIVGDAQTSPVAGQTTQSHAFYYEFYGGTMHDLGLLPGGTGSSATAINGSNTIAGWSSTLNGGTHAVVWARSGTGNYAIQDLGTLAPLAGNFSRANAINGSGQIVGISATPQNGQTAFLYSNGVMTDLNSLLPPGSPVALHEATAINDSGQILAYSLNFATNVSTGYILTPNTPPPVSVPNVVGLAQDAASAEIIAADLEVGTVTIQNNAAVPAGVVINQTPPTGSTLRIGAPVNLIVSSGPVSVPNVVGLPYQTAYKLITSTGLEVTASFQLDTTTSLDVIEESPQAGTLVAIGSAVNIVFSTQQFITVPNVIGLNANVDATAGALDVLQEAHFCTYPTSPRSSYTIPFGIVISQDPPAGTRLGVQGDYGGGGNGFCVGPSNGIVNLVVSSGPPAVLTAQLLSSSVDSRGTYIVNIVITNTGSAAANLPALTAASLVVVQSGKAVTTPMSTVPAVQNNLGPGATANVILTFPASAGSAGAPAALRWLENYTGGAASGTLRFMLP